MPDANQNTPQDSDPSSVIRLRNTRLKWFTASLFTAALVWLAAWLFYFQYHESTDDAYANGSMININTAIPGSVVAYFADDTDLVKEGQRLVLLDPTDYEIAYERSLAELAGEVLQVRNLYDQVSVNRANVEAKKVELSRTKFDYDNRREVVDTGAVSLEDFIHSRDNFFAAECALKQAEFELQAAIDLMGPTSIERHPRIEQQKARVREAYYNLKHCTVLSPATGYVAQRSVDVGERANPTTALMAVIPADYVWVDANFKETQLTYMRVGQPARVTFDMYGSKVEFEGKVLGIASGTGSVFSLIPPQNATGNWIKIVQRLPVRISLDPEMVKQYPIRVGISAEVSVDIADQTGPRLVQVTSQVPVNVTSVFDIHLDEVNKKIDEIIAQNL